MPMFTSPRAFQKPTKEPIEGLETPMEKYNQYSPKSNKSGEQEINVVSPRDIKDDNNLPDGLSEDPEAELSMTDIEHEQTQLNDRVSTNQEETEEIDDANTVANN